MTTAPAGLETRLFALGRPGGVVRVQSVMAKDVARRESEGWHPASLEEVVEAYRRADWQVAGVPGTARRSGALPRHDGESAWIIGSGPSINDARLELLRGRLTIGVNRCLRPDFWHGRRLPFVPSYLVIQDARCIGRAVGRDPGFPWMVALLERYRDDGGRLVVSSPLAGDRLVRSWPSSRRWVVPHWRHVGWSHDPATGWGANYTTVSAALQWAAWCGVARAHLLGVDLGHGARGETHSFGTSARNLATDPANFLAMRACFALSAIDARAAGLEVLDCSPARRVPGAAPISLEESVRAAEATT